ncbi:hypothetical protein DFH11DRAFT_845208 [Phellopilus nigrolimitatus]|nr:hypothetical protein DFH11DRAFT_845208 [Phellopilus nigrolimitatus]
MGGSQGSSGRTINISVPNGDAFMNTHTLEGPPELVMRSSAYLDHVSGTTTGPTSSTNIPTPSKTSRSVRVQLASYVAEMFSARGDRKFAFAVLVEGNDITLFFYHRSAIIQADPFDIASNPTYFALLLLMFYRDLPDLGFNEIMGYCNPFDFTDESTNKLQSGLLESVKGSDTPLDISKIVLGEKLASPYCLIGRGTSVIKANIDGYKLVIKFSWQVKTRKNEDKFILDARTLLDIIKYIPEIFGKAVVNDMTPVAKLRDACMTRGKIFEVREFRALVMREYFHIYDLGPRDFWSVIVQIAKCLHTLFVRLKMLHGDISISNIAFYRNDKNEIIAVLLDFDLASYFPLKQSSNHRTGTAPFMAREVLNLNDKDFTRALHHDLESLFYIVVWYSVGYKGYKIPKKGDILADWRKGSWEKILVAKNQFISGNAIQPASMAAVLKHVEDEDLRFCCKGIGSCFHDADADAGYQQTLANIKMRELSRPERALAEAAASKAPMTLAPPVTYAEWMKGAGEDPSCTCCQQMGATQ